MEHASEKRTLWRNPDIEKTFLETCIQEVSSNGRLGSSLKPSSWIKVKEVLETTHGFAPSQKQMKNHYDYLKDKYQVWLPITMKTGNVYDPTTNATLMSNTEWDEYIKAHPKAKALRISPLPFPDLCRALFDGITATGAYGWSPSCTNPRPWISSSSPVIDVDASLEENGPTSENDDIANVSQSQFSNPLGGQKMRKKIKVSHQNEIDDEIRSALKTLTENDGGPTYEECKAKLDELGWEEPLYSGTALVFCEGAIYRKAWMSFKEINTLEMWAKAAWKKFGFF